jgi:hypothetical protein
VYFLDVFQTLVCSMQGRIGMFGLWTVRARA